MATKRAGRFFREALDAHPTPTLIVSRAGTALYANPAAEEILGISAPRLVMHPLAGAPRVGPPLLELGARAMAEGATAHAEVDLGPPHGLVLATAAPIGPRSVRAAEIRLRPPQGRIDLETLAAGLAHEIKNPLAGLKGAAELLRDELPAGSPLASYTELIAREASRVDGLVRSLLDLTRPLTVHQRPENIHAICDDVILLAQPPKGVRLERRYDPSLPEVELDREPITQVLLNLVKNALEAMQGRAGAVTIETGVAPGMKVRYGGRTRPLLRIAVVDEGPGLPEGIELFTPFATTKPRGTGLGLVVSRRIAEAHGGRLELRNRRNGGGAEAELLLPL